MRTAICVIIKDEQRYLKEWIDYNLGIGFNQIHLFEDFGSTSHKDIADQYEGQVFLHNLSECKNAIRMVGQSDKSCMRQFDLFVWFAENYKDKLDWCAFIDVDEYIVTENGLSFTDLLEENNDAPGLYLYWKNIGASGHISRPKGKLVDCYSEEVNLVRGDEAWCYKSIVNMKYYSGFRSIHEAYGLQNTLGFRTPRIKCYHKAWINHYFTKSYEDWCERFYKRGDLIWGHRRLSQFFEINTSMMHQKEQASEMLDKLLRDECKRNGSYICKVKDNAWGLKISKCGLTTLSVVAADYFSKNNSEPYDKARNAIEHYSIPLQKTGCLLFSVYRDPVERWKSFYKDKVINSPKYTPMVELFDLYYHSVEELICVTEKELTNHVGSEVDGHIRRQVDYYSEADVDIIVPIEHLDAFLKSQGITPPPHQNVSKGEKPILTPEQEARIKKLYAADYELLKSPKLWKPSK